MLVSLNESKDIMVAEGTARVLAQPLNKAVEVEHVATVWNLLNSILQRLLTDTALCIFAQIFWFDIQQSVRRRQKKRTPMN